LSEGHSSAVYRSDAGGGLLPNQRANADAGIAFVRISRFTDFSGVLGHTFDCGGLLLNRLAGV